MNRNQRSVRALGAATALAARIGWMLLVVAAPSAATFSPELAPFSIRTNGETIPYRVFAIYVMPGRKIEVERVGKESGEIEVRADGIEARRLAPRRWSWRAPTSPGLRELEIRDPATDEAMRLNVFVLVPASAIEEERLNGYKIGAYPERPFRSLSAYQPPTGFVEVTDADRATRVAPHFTLGQFLCKQAGGPPRYVALRERLLLKLEYLLSLANRRGHAATTFAVLSGFRTPFYNQAIGNVRNSRHLWGGAADIFIDEAPKDGVMDDLNDDGRVDVDDARLLYRIFERASGTPEHREFTGGLGVYSRTPAHGPFVHVDARGYSARWGKR